MIEEWRNILGYEGLYQVSSLGRVKSLARTYRAPRKGVMTNIPIPTRILTANVLKVGYLAVHLSRHGKTRTMYVHSLVCEAWHGPRPEGCDVAHWDGDKFNCHPDNLRWATRQENLKDKVRQGKQPRGDDLWFTKIPDAIIPTIRADGEPSQVWAKRLGVSASHIRSIRRGTERKYAEEPAL